MATHRKFGNGHLVVASHNQGKLREIADLIRPLGIEAISAAALNLPEPEETGTTFAANAEIKARAAATATRLPTLADDSGLVVNALGGAPGVYSARWAGPTKDFSLAIARVERELRSRSPSDKAPSAHFLCALSLAWPDDHIETFEGRIDGHLTFPPRGSKGFGYDPIFIAEGMSETFGELEPVRKHQISHRARAFAKLLAACFDGH